jgi:cytidylate kinase
MMGNNKRDIFISQELIDDKKLDWVNKVIMSQVELKSIISNEELGMILNLHKGNVSKRVSWLEKNEYVKIVIEKKQRKIYSTNKNIVSTNADTKQEVITNAPTNKDRLSIFEIDFTMKELLDEINYREIK